MCEEGPVELPLEIAKRWKITEKLGGCGAVYKVEDVKSHTKVGYLTVIS